MDMKKYLMEKINEINSHYEEDKKRCGGYSMAKYLHITAPEDYIESRTDWDTLKNYAEDMYYLLNDIKSIIEEMENEIEVEM